MSYHVDSEADGVCCPGCQSKAVPKEYTDRTPGASYRVRKCRDCGLKFRTAEAVVPWAKKPPRGRRPSESRPAA